MNNDMKMEALPEDFGAKLEKAMADAKELEAIIGKDEVLPFGINIRGKEAALITALSKSEDSDSMVRALIKRVPGTSQVEIISALSVIPDVKPVTSYYSTKHSFVLKLSDEVTLKMKYTILGGVELQMHDKVIQDVFLSIEKESPTLERALVIFTDLLIDYFVHDWEITLEHELQNGTGAYTLTAASTGRTL